MVQQATQEFRQVQSPAVFEDEHYEIVTTNYGWTTSEDLNFSRRILTGEVWNATLKHPRYNASANWSDLEASQDPSRTLVVMLDVDTCLDFLYPKYVQRKWWLNAETESGRFSGGGYMDPVRKSCPYILRASTSPALRANPKSRLLLLNCFGWPRDNLKTICGRGNATFTQQVIQNPQVVFASYSETKRQAIKNQDIGLPPPAVKPVSLSAFDRRGIENCKPRKFLFSFQGHGDGGRQRLDALSTLNASNVFVRIMDRNNYRMDLVNKEMDSYNYHELLLNSTFGGAPRGDALYSYRFAETLSAGTIPVVYADDWLPPFNEHVVDWENCCAVFIPEDKMADTKAILEAIPTERVCEMQKRALKAWDHYLSNRSGWVHGFVESALAQSGVVLARTREIGLGHNTG